MQRDAQTLALAFPSHRPRRMTGLVELGVAQALSPRLSRPDQVTEVLATVFAEIGGAAADKGRVKRLASGAREWLLQRAAGLFWRDTGWFQATCAVCNAAYDLPLILHDAPRKPASDRFPVVTVRTSLGERSFEAPNGLHEASLARLQDADPVRALVAACGLGRDPQEDASAFSQEDLEVIETALDLASPDVADEVSTICPSCKTAATARIDPLEFAFPTMASVLCDVHTIAVSYHWTEDAILSLPSSRRRAYARIIREGGRR